MPLLLGYDIGSSSIKAALLDAETGALVASATSPADELPIAAPHPGWAEQHPDLWWEHVVAATRLLASAPPFDPAAIAAIGIAYQMHGLVLVDAAGAVLRPAIIWCDSRAVPQGRAAAEALGRDFCLHRLLNLPGNFTASKLAWVREHEPEIFRRARHMLLPGQWVAFRMTGEPLTTPSGLSEGTLWDFSAGARADFLLNHFGIDPALVPRSVPVFSRQGELTAAAAAELGLRPGTPVTYRAGDQPNNALALGVLEPGQAAVTAGTSGVIYAVGSGAGPDPRSRVNIFAHVNHAPGHPRHGVLLCVNGTGSLYRWLRREIAPGLDYSQINALAAAVPPGAAGLSILPYGNGAERTLDNAPINASVHGWDFNRHTSAHFLRAAQEGIVFALDYGLSIMRSIGVDPVSVRAGNANMFLSPLFRQLFAAVTGARVELLDTDGAQGAARGAGIGAGIFADPAAAFAGLRPVATIEPDPALREALAAPAARWRAILDDQLQGETRP